MTWEQKETSHRHREGGVWKQVVTHVLEGTTLELHSEYGSGLFYVVDRRRPARALTNALPLSTAKQSAQRMAQRMAEGLPAVPTKKEKAGGSE